MKHNRFAGRSFALLLALALALAVLPAAAGAAEGGLYATGYTVQDASGAPAAGFSKGSAVSVAVTLKDTSVTSDSFDLSSYDFSKLIDSFSGGAVSAVKESAGSDPLLLRVTCAGLVYSGSGQSLKLQISKKGDAGSYQTMEITVTEAVPDDAARPPVQDNGTPDTAPAPMVLVSRTELASPIEAGQEAALTITFQNLSHTMLKSPVVTLSPSDGLTIAGGASSFALRDIGGKKSESLRITVRGSGVIASPSQSIGVELKFNYYNNLTTTQGTVSDRLSIPALGRDSVPQPAVLISRSPVKKPLSPGEALSVTVHFQNAGKAKLVSPVVSVTSSDSLLILNDVSTFLLPDLEPQGGADVVVKVQAAREISSANQSINTEMRFSYDNGGVLTAATVSDKVNLSANVTAAGRSDAPVPNVIIKSFHYGDGSVPAGGRFTLGFTFQNTGRLKIENIVATIDGGDSIAMDGSTNTFFYSALAAGASQSQEVPMQAMATAKSGAQSIGVGFKYEYVDGQKRSSAAADIKISVPVFQPDRFQLNAPALPETAVVGEELALSLSYVNKGKGEVSNVEAAVDGDGVDSPARTQYLGNISAGASGSIGFALTPNTAGEISVTLKVTYEDADQKLQTREFPVTLSAAEPAGEEEFPEEADTPAAPGRFPWLAAALALAAGGGALLLVLRRRRKTGAAAEPAADWDGWDDPAPASAEDAPRQPGEEPASATGGKPEEE